MHVIAGKAVCFKEAAQPEFNAYIDQVCKNAQVLASGLQDKSYKLVTNGTDNHLVLLNLADKGITGKDAEKWLDDANITTNKNTVPNDPQSPFVTSGLRLGTPAMTTRGFKEDDVLAVVDAIDIVISSKGEAAAMEKARAIVKALCEKYPLYDL